MQAIVGTSGQANNAIQHQTIRRPLSEVPKRGWRTEGVGARRSFLCRALLVANPLPPTPFRTSDIRTCTLGVLIRSEGGCLVRRVCGNLLLRRSCLSAKMHCWVHPDGFFLSLGVTLHLFGALTSPPPFTAQRNHMQHSPSVKKYLKAGVVQQGATWLRSLYCLWCTAKRSHNIALDRSPLAFAPLILTFPSHPPLRAMEGVQASRVSKAQLV